MCAPPFAFQRHCAVVPCFDGGMRVKLPMKSWSIKTKPKTLLKSSRRRQACLGEPPLLGAGADGAAEGDQRGKG